VRWYVHLGFNRMLRRLTLIAIGASVLAGLMLAVIWLLRDFITDDLFHKTIGDRDRLLLIYGLVILVGVVRDVYQCGLIALGDLKNNFWVTCVSTVAALSIFWVGIPYWGVAAAFIGQLTGELLSLVGVVVLLMRGGRLATTTA
jgi:O-antigen/teichoic acid export membrane protein